MQSSSVPLLLALLWDHFIGEPPSRWHPVVWMGNLIKHLRQLPGFSTRPVSALLHGGIITAGGAGLIIVATQAMQKFLGPLPAPVRLAIEVWLLKITFSLHGLDAAGREVEAALHQHNLPEARRLLSWHLVSRNTSQLSTGQVAGAAVSSIAENTSDSIIAPLLWYAIGGLPAALAYRYINTCDSMLGYRDAAREWLGKIPARTDDVLNFIPARLTALLFVLQHPSAWRIWRHDAQRTDSPNAGHPMSAMAGALAVRLEKTDHYSLNASAPEPTAKDIQRARHMMYGAVTLFVISLLLTRRR